MKPRLYEFDSFRLDLSKRLLSHSGKELPLMPRTFELLVFLIENRNKVIQRADLIEDIWWDSDVQDENLTKQISLLRQKLGKNYIKTIPKRGYKFVAEVREISESEDAKLKEITESKTVGGELNSSVEFGADSTSGEKEAVEANSQSAEKTSPERDLRTVSAGHRRLLLILPLAVLIIAAIGVSAWYVLNKKSSSITQIRTLAILPFQSIGNEPADQELELGLADALITRFGRLQQISVQPTSAIAKFNQPERDVVAIGGELGVDAVLDGRVQSENGSLRVTVQLISVKDGKLLWSDSYRESFGDIFTIQEEIAEKTAEMLELELTDDERRFLSQRYTKNAEAYRLYLKAQALRFSGLSSGAFTSRIYYKQAIDLDPDFALAYAGMADSYSFYYGMSPKDGFHAMKFWAEEALRRDPALGEAHTALAFALWRGDWDWTKSESHFKRALELSPRYHLAYVRYSLLLAGQQRFDEAISVIERGEKNLPTNSNIIWTKGVIYEFSRQHDKAIEQFQKILRQKPLDYQTIFNLGLTYNFLGNYEEAVPTCEKALSLQEAGSASFCLGYAYAKSGQKERAREIADKLSAKASPEGSPGGAAIVYAALRDKDRAFQELEISIEQREWYGYALNVFPAFDDLRDDLRFDEMLRRVNLK
jgi:TolB-like protein/DNA-binding winged helix-turn-helix (wHTH) protein/Tfp pilus assembly protein PilF